MTREEAINVIRSIHRAGAEREALAILIPELRESEDERIRKEIIHYILYKASGVPEKQEHEWVSYLEKQKENSKSADSIPSDCTSDAKCEDRWYKVEDSLPDNGRLVLANDCLGNVLLARYDGEGNWEVSVYDNEDYYCRNTITKWCEIPSEKQKEQKPVAAEDMPYITDEHFYEREPVDSFKYKLAEYMTRSCTKKEGPYGYEYGISAETILKMAEEELLKRGVVQKPAQTVDEKEYIRTIKSLITDFIREKKPDDVTFYQRIYDWLDGRHIEQKPVEYLSKDKVYAIMTKLTNLSYSNLIPLNSDEYKKINEITSDVRSLLDYPIEEKPAEWSEEDEIYLQDALWCVEKAEKSCKDEEDKGACWSAKRWLKSLLSHPKSSYDWEPSEEQMNELFHALIPGAEYDCDILEELYFGLKSWLDSIRERPEQK